MARSLSLISLFVFPFRIIDSVGPVGVSLWLSFLLALDPSLKAFLFPHDDSRILAGDCGKALGASEALHPGRRDRVRPLARAPFGSCGT